MNRRSVAWTAWASTVSLVLAGLVLSVLNEPNLQAWLQRVLERVLIPAQAVAYATVGLLIARRRPDNSVGWLFAGVGLFAGAYAVCFEYSTYAFFTDPGSLPLARWAAWMQAWVYVPALGVSFLFVPLLFPTGRPLSARWRPVIGLAGAAVVALTLSDALARRRLDMFPADNPIEVPAGVASALGLAVPLLFAPATLLCVAALIVRWRRARGDERQQLKWFAFAALFLPISVLSWVIVDLFSLRGPAFEIYEQVVATSAFLGLPTATGIAILRYRLYDIDRIISRTLAYGALTALLVGGYLGAVLALQSVLPLDDDSRSSSRPRRWEWSPRSVRFARACRARWITVSTAVAMTPAAPSRISASGSGARPISTYSLRIWWR